ncbi:MAG TPA: D-alanine--D-alanine ligase [Planctomycetota bacterium]|nr:D-alanine--D-alanine ligase [Planctomycetota bacterium]
MRIGIAYDLKTDFKAPESAALPEDAFEEYDSEETVDAIAAALRAAGHETVKLGGGRRFLERAMKATGIDLVFNIAEGRGSRSREAHVPAACEILGLPFTHSDPLTLAVTLDKALTKRIVASHGVPTAPFALIEKVEDLDRLELPRFPVIAKPDWEGSSMGVRKRSRCEDLDALRSTVAGLLRDYQQPVLVERFLTGAEITVGVLGNGAEAKVVGMMEIAPKKGTNESFIYSLEVKRNYLEEVEYHVPPRLAPPERWEVEAVALGAYRALGCRDVSRVDIRLDADGKPFFIEVNPLPGLNPTTGDLPILAARSGVPYERLIQRIVENARERLALATPVAV